MFNRDDMKTMSSFDTIFNVIRGPQWMWCEQFFSLQKIIILKQECINALHNYPAFNNDNRHNLFISDTLTIKLESL